MYDFLTKIAEYKTTNVDLKKIINNIIAAERISADDALFLYRKADLSLLSLLASFIKERLHSKHVYFVQNVHLEPTNICICNCKFCSYVRKPHQEGAWDLSIDEIKTRIRQIEPEVKEIHITGGTHPQATVESYIEIINVIREINPEIHIKAFSAAELYAVFTKAGIAYLDGLKRMKQAGLNSIPGGGAEIFDEKIRKEICPDKCTSEQWLAVHKASHEAGMKSNATMLYGHLESYEQRVDHMERLRKLQDVAGGFNAFIPLKFKNKNNLLDGLTEVSIVEDLKNYAVARIYLDNIPHLKAYWPMLGKEATRISLQYGVDDVDGTINNTTSIYAAAGADDENPTMNIEEMKQLITKAGFMPVERDSDYKALAH
jgi:aminodeoxyfutalosine synthase